MQKSVIFVKKDLKINIEDKKYCKFRDNSHYTREYRGAANRVCNSKYNVPKKIPIVFHSVSNCDCFFKKTICSCKTKY